MRAIQCTNAIPTIKILYFNNIWLLLFLEHGFSKERYTFDIPNSILEQMLDIFIKSSTCSKTFKFKAASPRRGRSKTMKMKHANTSLDFHIIPLGIEKSSI